MARRPLTGDQLIAAGAIAQALASEKTAVFRAKQEAQDLIRRRTAEARERTNSAIYAGHVGYGLTIAVIMEQGFSTNRVAVNDRLKEYVDAHPDAVQRAEEAVINEATKAEAKGVTVSVNPDSGEVTVTMLNYTAPDVGDSITGYVTFDRDGEVITYEPRLQSRMDANPLWALLIWQLPDVLAQL